VETEVLARAGLTLAVANPAAGREEVGEWDGGDGGRGEHEGIDYVA
jgi:hypothetical protein